MSARHSLANPSEVEMIILVFSFLSLPFLSLVVFSTQTHFTLSCSRLISIEAREAVKKRDTWHWQTEWNPVLRRQTNSVCYAYYVATHLC